MKSEKQKGIPRRKQSAGIPRRLILILGMALLATSAFSQDIFELAAIGTPDEVQQAIREGSKVDTRDEDGFTPLMWAATLNPDAQVLSILVRAGAKVNEKSSEEIGRAHV